METTFNTQSKREGKMARNIEEQTSKNSIRCVPLGINRGYVSIVDTAALPNRNTLACLLANGQLRSCCLAFTSKLVKQRGHDKDDRIKLFYSCTLKKTTIRWSFLVPATQSFYIWNKAIVSLWRQ